MITLERRAGHLAEARFEGEILAPHLKEFSTAMAQVIIKAGQRLVFITDMRTCELLAKDIEAQVLGQLRSDNWAIEYSAFMLRPGTPFCAQMQRIIGMARNPSRQSFTDVESLLSWLSPHLSSDELHRAGEFVAERT